MPVEFPPSRDAALSRLEEFLPRAGREYASRRNYDRPEHRDVSRLSPYIRRRLLTESEVLATVLEHHSQSSAEKFVQEVFWRTYWKGWLELRPGVWSDYKAELNAAYNRVQTESGLRSGWEAACLGETEIHCFNHWAQELVSTGYIHNHARMWFASIWIFTLRLPWELGADFFLRHLLDGDPASNTLGWRWVAGLQTKGKTYLARPDNIEKYTDGRFRPTASDLAGFATPLEGRDISRDPCPIGDRIEPDLKTALLIHDDDLDIDHLVASFEGASFISLSTTDELSPGKISPQIIDFVMDSMSDTILRHSDQLGENCGIHTETAAIVGWAKSRNLDQVVANYAPVGPGQDALDRLRALLCAEGIRLATHMKEYDRECWPHATHGFFRFKDKIPKLIESLSLDQKGADSRQAELFAIK